MDVLLTGPIPTPAVAMLTRSMRCDLGVMISASHNPYEDNGIKLFGPDGYKLSDERRGRDRGADRRRPRRPACRLRRRSAAPSASRASRTATSNSPSAPCPAQLDARRPARRHRLRQRRRLQGRAGGAVGARRRGDLDRRRARRLQHQPTKSARPRPRRWSPRCASCGPTSASRSTATPTGW